MKQRSEVHNRLRGILVRELDRRVEEATKRLPHLCQHNHRQPLDGRRTVNGEPNELFNRVSRGRGLPVLQTIGFCMVGSNDPENWGGTICEDDIDAQRCPLFTSKTNKQKLWGEMLEDLRTPGWVEDNLPGAAELVWVLDRKAPIDLPWWKRLWFWALRIRIEPVAPPSNPARFLPAPSVSDPGKDSDADLHA